MLFKGTSTRIPGKTPHCHAGRLASAVLDGSNLARSAVLLSFGAFALVHHGESHGAEVAAACDSSLYKACPAFSVSLTKGNHSQIGSGFGGYARSKGDWTINVRYQPKESCATISILVDMGPLDMVRNYKRAFSGGAGTFRDKGTFVHKRGNIDDALTIVSSSCRMPDQEKSTKRTQQQQELDQVLNPMEANEDLDVRQDDGGGKEGGLGSEFERQLLAMEQQTAREAQEEIERLRRETEASERALREAQAASQRYSDDLLKNFSEAVDRRLEEITEQHKQETITHKRREQRQQQQASGSGLDTFLQGMSMGASIINSLRGGRQFATTPSRSSVGGTGSSTCDRARHRIAQQVQSQSFQTGGGMCNDTKSYLRTLTTARSGLANAGCPRSEINQYDQVIRAAKQRLNQVCN